VVIIISIIIIITKLQPADIRPAVSVIPVDA